MSLRSYARLYAVVMAPDSDEETIRKAGVTQAQSDLVMDMQAEAMERRG